MEKISEKKYKVINGVIQGKQKMLFDWEYDLSNGRSRGHDKSYAFYLQNVETKDAITIKQATCEWFKNAYKWVQGEFTYFLSMGKEEAIIIKALS